MNVCFYIKLVIHSLEEFIHKNIVHTGILDNTILQYAVLIQSVFHKWIRTMDQCTTLIIYHKILNYCLSE